MNPTAEYIIHVIAGTFVICLLLGMLLVFYVIAINSYDDRRENRQAHKEVPLAADMHEDWNTNSYVYANYDPALGYLFPITETRSFVNFPAEDPLFDLQKEYPDDFA